MLSGRQMMPPVKTLKPFNSRSSLGTAPYELQCTLITGLIEPVNFTIDAIEVLRKPKYLCARLSYVMLCNVIVEEFRPNTCVAEQWEMFLR